jgi:hypothetical protein
MENNSAGLIQSKPRIIQRFEVRQVQVRKHIREDFVVMLRKMTFFRQRNDHSNSFVGHEFEDLISKFLLELTKT